jgi:hypothetical protein
MAPVTNGVAIDMPLESLYWLPSHVDVIAEPGTTGSTSLPVEENSDLA